MKTCPLCNHPLKVSNSRDIQTLHEGHYCDRMIRKADSLGITHGIIRERRCDGCKAVLFTHEVVIHLEKPKNRKK